MTLYCTEHAVERFVQRFRPGLALDAARAELEQLAAGAAPTRRRTINRDARVYVAQAPDGEVVGLAVRDGTVVTVLPSTSRETVAYTATADDLSGLLAESAEDVAAGRAMAAPPPPAPDPAPEPTVDPEAAAERSRRLNAEKVLREHELGVSISRPALRRACALIGVPVPAPRRSVEAAAVLRIDGGRWDGVRVEIRPGDGLNALVGKLLAAMRRVAG